MKTIQCLRFGAVRVFFACITACMLLAGSVQGFTDEAQDSLKKEFLAKGPEGFSVTRLSGIYYTVLDVLHFLGGGRVLRQSPYSDDETGTWRFDKASRSVELTLSEGKQTIEEEFIFSDTFEVNRMDAGMWAEALQLAVPNIVSMRASSALPDEAGYKYGPEQAFDGNPVTAWNEGTPGSGAGEIIIIRFDRSVTADGLDIMGGYFDPLYFRANNRVKRLRMELFDSNGMPVLNRALDVSDKMESQRFSFNPADFIRARFTVLDIFPGEQYNDLAIAEMAFSRGGKRIDFSMQPGLVPALSAALRQDASSPVPPAEKIVFVSEAGGRPDIWIMDRDGKNQRNITPDKARDMQPRWSKALGLVAFASDRGGAFDIYAMGIDGSNPKSWTAGGAPKGNVNRIAPAWSPDGLRLGYVEIEDDNFKLVITDSKGARLWVSPPDFVGSLDIGWNETSPYSGDLRHLLVDSVRLDWLSQDRLRMTLATMVNDEVLNAIKEYDSKGNPLEPRYDAAFLTTLDGKQRVFTHTTGDIKTICIPGGLKPDLNVYAADAAGGPSRALAPSPYTEANACPSIDNRSAVFASSRDGGFDIYRVGLDGKSLFYLTDTDAADYDPQCVAVKAGN